MHGDTNVVSFMRVTNEVSDMRYGGRGSGGTMLRMVSNGRETCILIPFSTFVHQLFLIKNYLKCHHSSC